MKFFYFFVFLLVCALFETGCVTDTATGEKKFKPLEAAKVVIGKVDEIPDETKASALEALAWLLGATGFGGGAAVLLSRGANYYRNKAATNNVVATSSPTVTPQSDDISDQGKV